MILPDIQQIDLTNISNFPPILEVVPLLAPGFLFRLARSKFVTGRVATLSKATAEYVIFSTIYYAIFSLVFNLIDINNQITLIFWVFLFPLILGMIFGGLTQWGWAKKVAKYLEERFKLNLQTPYPTGWDKAFSALDGTTSVVIYTKDLGDLRGKFGNESNAANDLNMRDIYLEEVEVQEDGSSKGEEIPRMWISEDQIRAIKFFNEIEEEYDE